MTISRKCIHVFSLLHFECPCAPTHTHMITHISGICRITARNVLIFYQTTLFTDCIIQLINYTCTQLFACNFLYRIRLFCWINALLLTSNEDRHNSTFAFMFYQTTHVTVCLITHITHVAALTMTYVFTSHQTSLITV